MKQDFDTCKWGEIEEHWNNGKSVDVWHVCKNKECLFGICCFDDCSWTTIKECIFYEYSKEDKVSNKIDPNQKFGPLPDEQKRRLDNQELVEDMKKAMADVMATKTVEEGPKEQVGKPEYAVLPWDALEYVVRVFEYGASQEKYKKPFTYVVGITYSKLFSGIIRHAKQWFYDREELDQESGCHHLAHCAANALMLLSMLSKKKFDNRPEHMKVLDDNEYCVNHHVCDCKEKK